MNRGWLIELLKQEAQSCADDDDESGGVLGGYAEKFRQAAAMLQSDGETIEMLAEHLDCMIDYVCESNAWRMVGAQNALREARDALDALAALKENSDGPA